MSAEGKQIVAAVRQVRQLYRSLSLLLQTANKLIEAAGCNTRIAGGNAHADGSYAFDRPESWAPRDVFRLFMHPEHPNLLAFVSVILDEIQNEERVSEPLVCGGWFDYGAGGEPQSKWDYYLVRLFLNDPDAKPDGVIRSIPLEGFLQKDSPIRAGHCLAVPLVEVKNEADLHSRIWAPLVQAIRASSESRLTGEIQ